MKLLACLRALLAPAADQPLVILGPGGDFTEHVVVRDGRLTRERPIEDRDQRGIPQRHTMQEGDERRP